MDKITANFKKTRNFMERPTYENAGVNNYSIDIYIASLKLH